MAQLVFLILVNFMVIYPVDKRYPAFEQPGPEVQTFYCNKFDTYVEALKRRITFLILVFLFIAKKVKRAVLKL